MGRYDDLSQETWGRADSDMPQHYLDDVLTQINTAQPAKRKHAPINIEEQNRLFHQWKRATILECYGKDIGEYKRV